MRSFVMRPARLLSGGVLLLLALPLWSINDWSGLDPVDGHTQELLGEWEMVPERLLMPGEFPAGLPSQAAPAVFNGPGVATYRYRLILPQVWIGQDLGLYVPPVNTAARFFINGQELFQTGFPDEFAEEAVPVVRDTVHQFRSAQAELELVVQVSCHEYRTGGIFQAPRIGRAAAAENYLDWLKLLATLLLGSLAVMFLYHLFLSLVHVDDKPLWYFSWLLFLILAQWVISQFPLIDWHGWFDLKLRLEYLAYFLLVPVFLQYARSLYPGEFPAWVVLGSFGLGLAFSALSLFLPLLAIDGALVPAFRIYASLVVILTLGLLGLAAARRRDYVWIYMLGTALLLAGAINDSLFHARLLRSAPVIQYCILGFIFTQAAINALRYNRLFRENERMNRNLEHQVQERTQDLHAAMLKLEEASLTDPLTGLRNRRYVYETILHETSAMLSRNEYGLRNAEKRSICDLARGTCFLLLDIDFFKHTNDQYGHDAGDLVLTQFGKVLHQVIRGEDLAVRWGGEEFLVVLKAIDTGAAMAVAGKIRAALAAQPYRINQHDETAINKSASIGVAILPFMADKPALVKPEQAIRLADLALYAAKHGGRNRAVAVWPGAAVDLLENPETWTWTDERLVEREVIRFETISQGESPEP